MFDSTNLFKGAAAGAAAGSVIPGLGTVTGGIVGGLFGGFGGPQEQNQNFEYEAKLGEANTAQYEANRDFSTTANSLRNQGNQMLSGTSPLLTALRNQNQSSIYGAAAQNANQMNSALASRGAGGFSGLYDQISQNKAGEQMGQANLGIAQFGQQAGMSALGQAMSAYGQMDSNALNQNLNNQNAINQMTLANISAQNEAQQFGLTGEYNQSAANMANNQAFGNQLLTMGMGAVMPQYGPTSASTLPRPTGAGSAGTPPINGYNQSV